MAYQSKYTGLQIDDILDSVEWKQGKIEDLASIRAGAQKGATALQSYTEKYTGTVTGIKINGVVKSGSGVIDLGTISTTETDPIFSASPAASITEAKKAEWDNKVDKVSGKQLSTEDFTTALKTKLEGLNNYDDTELSNAVETLRGDFDEIVSGDTTTAIKTFNEVIAFLDGLTDTQDLESIIASIEQQIAGKMDTLISGTNIKTINGESILGSGDLTIEGGAKVYEWIFSSNELDENGNITGTLTKEEFENIRDCDILTIQGVPCIKVPFGNNIIINFHTSASNNGSIVVSCIGIIINSNTYGYLGSPLETIIPTKTSQLENDNNFITPEDVAAVALSGSYNDLHDTPIIPSAVTESTVSGWGFTKNTGTYSKPSGGIPKSDLASAVQTSLGKADTALQSHQDISGKQDKLVSGTNIKTINGTSILGSGDITISGGSSSGSGAYAEVNHGTSDTTFALTPNTFHVWDEVASLTLDFGSETIGVANEYLFQFTSGATATTLSLPIDLKWTEELVIEPNMIYQVSILKGLASVLSWDNEVQLIDNHATITTGSGVINFAYPVASDLTISFYGRTTGMPTNMSATISSGEQSVSTEATAILYIVSITPKSDNIYNYTFDE